MKVAEVPYFGSYTVSVPLGRCKRIIDVPNMESLCGSRLNCLKVPISLLILAFLGFIVESPLGGLLGVLSFFVSNLLDA